MELEEGVILLDKEEEKSKKSKKNEDNEENALDLVKDSSDDISLDMFDITSLGSLVDDLKRLDISVQDVPDIEVREVVIKETGNFLNLRDNIINIPLEMLIFPFFTPAKQNKKVNFVYKFEDMGVTMSSTLISKSGADKVFQPSIFEEKIYTYLLSMYESKLEDEDAEEYIDFEISDFIVNFLGNKMNRTYYTKVEQSLKNLKNTEYQFEISNHTKLGNYKFEDEEFKLLTYQKLKVGKKIYYRVTLNKNIRKKIKEKRYVKYNSKSLVEIMNLDPIAARIYKYISKMRFDKDINTINLRTLAAIIPLKMDQVTERVGKDGKVKKYVLCRVKPVLQRVQKAFDILKELGYIEFYSEEFSKEENTYYITYKFNKDKDGTCHISSYIDSKPNNTNLSPVAKLAQEKAIENAKKDNKNQSKPATKITKTNSRPTESKPDKGGKKINFPEEINDTILKMKKNLVVTRLWDKRVENKIYKLMMEDGEEFVIKVLQYVTKNIDESVSTTLVQYINGVVGNVRAESHPNNLTLFGNDQGNLPKLTKTGIKRAASNFTTPVLQKSSESSGEGVTFESLDEYEKLKIEEKAIKLCCRETGTPEKILLTMKEKLRPAYLNTIKAYIERVMQGE